MGLGMLSKLSGVFFLLIPLMTSLLIPKAHKGGLVKKLLLSYCLPVLMILPILLHPSRERALSEIYLKTIVTSEGLTAPAWMELAKKNAITALNDLKPYLTFPILLICGVSLAMTMYKKDKRGLLLSMLCFMPCPILVGFSKGWIPPYFLGLADFSKGWIPPRYFLFVVSPLLALAAWGIVEVAGCKSRCAFHQLVLCTGENSAGLPKRGTAGRTDRSGRSCRIVLAPRRDPGTRAEYILVQHVSRSRDDRPRPL